MVEVPERIVMDPDVVFGKPRIRGTRLAAAGILEMLAAGESEEALLEYYPHITREDILACYEFAWRLVSDFRTDIVMSTELPDRIVRDPEILLGKPTIDGTRLSVELILDVLSAGEKEDYFFRNYPGIDRDDILACIEFGSRVVSRCRKKSVAA
jgi:uncharacterized protein (DUF433 family)